MIYTYIIEAHRVMDDNTTNEVGETARVPIIFSDYFLLISAQKQHIQTHGHFSDLLQSSGTQEAKVNARYRFDSGVVEMEKHEGGKCGKRKKKGSAAAGWKHTPVWNVVSA